jgi:hypothetical protein
MCFCAFGALLRSIAMKQVCKSSSTHRSRKTPGIVPICATLAQILRLTSCSGQRGGPGRRKSWNNGRRFKLSEPIRSITDLHHRCEIRGWWSSGRQSIVACVVDKQSRRVWQLPRSPVCSGKNRAKYMELTILCIYGLKTVRFGKKYYRPRWLVTHVRVTGPK